MADSPGSLQFSPTVRFWIFAGTFLLLIALCAVVLVGVYQTDWELLSQALAGTASLAPDVLDRLPFTSELTAAALGGVLAYVAPPRSSVLQTLVLLALAALCWLGYLLLHNVLGDKASQILQMADVSPGQAAEGAIIVLQDIATNIRTLCGVVFAAIIGLRLNPSVAVLNPQQGHPQPPLPEGQRAEPADVPDPSPGQVGGPVG